MKVIGGHDLNGVDILFFVEELPEISVGLAFFVIGLPSLSPALVPAHKALSNVATWSYAVASAAAFLFFGLNFGEEAVSRNNSVLKKS